MKSHRHPSLIDGVDHGSMRQLPSLLTRPARAWPPRTSPHHISDLHTIFRFLPRHAGALLSGALLVVPSHSGHAFRSATLSLKPGYPSRYLSRRMDEEASSMCAADVRAGAELPRRYVSRAYLLEPPLNCSRRAASCLDRATYSPYLSRCQFNQGTVSRIGPQDFQAFQASARRLPCAQRLVPGKG